LVYLSESLLELRNSISEAAAATIVALREPEATMPARKRELIEPHDGDKRYVRRDDQGQFTEEQVDVGRSLSQDSRQHAKRTVPAGQGDKGDRHGK
jgi:hypothetical protein